jgi:hypothetical protein
MEQTAVYTVYIQYIPAIQPAAICMTDSMTIHRRNSIDYIVSNYASEMYIVHVCNNANRLKKKLFRNFFTRLFLTFNPTHMWNKFKTEEQKTTLAHKSIPGLTLYSLLWVKIKKY